MKRHVKVLWFIAVVAIAIGAWLLFGPTGIAAAAASGFAWVFGHLDGRRSGGAGNKPKGKSVREATERSDKATEKLQDEIERFGSEGNVVRESLERSAVELGEAIESGSDNARQLDLALDIFEGREKGSPDRLH